MEAARQTFGNDVKTGFDIFGTIDSEHPFGLLEQQCPTRGAGRRCGKAVVQQNEGGGGHVMSAVRSGSSNSIAHMGGTHENIEEIPA
jgi:hypothetical protein